MACLVDRRIPPSSGFGSEKPGKDFIFLCGPQRLAVPDDNYTGSLSRSGQDEP
jgi:hypothetical protein